MANPLDAPQILNREFLEIRAKILEIGAALDRLDRAEGSVEDDPRRARIQEALAVLVGDEPGRAEQIQMIFSRVYEADWRAKFSLAQR